jgi:hypothetical protein
MALLLEVINDRGELHWHRTRQCIEEVEPCLCQGAPRAIFPDALF